MGTRGVLAAAATVAGLALTTGSASAAWVVPALDVSPSAAGATFVDVGTDATGASVLTWQDGGSVFARRFRADGSFGAKITVSTSVVGNTPVHVAVDDSGNATVVWLQSDGSTIFVQARRLDAGDALGPVLTLTPGPPSGNAFTPEVAAGAQGIVTVVWRQNATSPPSAILARQISATGTLGPATALTTPDVNGDKPKVSADDAGNATASWFEGTTVRARRLSAAGALGPALEVATAAANGGSLTSEIASSKTGAAGGAGEATVTWLTADNTVMARRVSAAGDVLAPAFALSDPNASTQTIAGGPQGTAFAAWPMNANGALVGRRIDATGTPQTPITVSDPATAGAKAISPRAAIDGQSNAYVAWTDLVGDPFSSFVLYQAARAIAPSGTLDARTRIGDATKVTDTPRIDAGSAGATAGFHFTPVVTGPVIAIKTSRFTGTPGAPPPGGGGGGTPGGGGGTPGTGGGTPGTGGGGTTPPPGGGTPATPDKKAPAVSGLAVSPKAFKPKKGTKGGTVLKLTLSEPAQLALVVSQSVPGRRKKAACVKPTRKLAKAKACKRLVAAGKLTAVGKTGANAVPFTGVVKGKALKAGAYVLSVVATDAAGNASTALTAKLTVR